METTASTKRGEIYLAISAAPHEKCGEATEDRSEGVPHSHGFVIEEVVIRMLDTHGHEKAQEDVRDIKAPAEIRSHDKRDS